MMMRNIYWFGSSMLPVMKTSFGQGGHFLLTWWKHQRTKFFWFLGKQPASRTWAVSAALPRRPRISQQDRLWGQYRYFVRRVLCSLDWCRNVYVVRATRRRYPHRGSSRTACHPIPRSPSNRSWIYCSLCASRAQDRNSTSGRDRQHSHAKREWWNARSPSNVRIGMLYGCRATSSHRNLPPTPSRVRYTATRRVPTEKWRTWSPRPRQTCTWARAAGRLICLRFWTGRADNRTGNTVHSDLTRSSCSAKRTEWTTHTKSLNAAAAPSLFSFVTPCYLPLAKLRHGALQRPGLNQIESKIGVDRSSGEARRRRSARLKQKSRFFITLMNHSRRHLLSVM